jgi:(E)-4-hydroxy-3-methylbut-2-enyl-diphosphate synthase
MKTESPIKRRISRQIHVGDVAVGGDAPISVQSMTNTETCDVTATVAQVRAIADAGADIVRISVPSMDAAEAFREIRAQVTVPLVADIHFDHKIALKVAEYGVDCLRINPGNIGRDDKVREVIDSARDKGIPIRIGVNAGSLGKDLQRKYGEPTAEAFREIRAQVTVPLVADIHFDHKIALKVAEYGVDCLRINPGNIGRDDKVREVIDSARDKGIPIRIGVNAGSLGKDLQRKYGEPTAEALVESAMHHVDILDKFNYPDFKVSVKASQIFMAVEAYRLLAKQIDQPLHLGITEAGGLRGGTVKSAVGLGMLLMDGIGDTIRISLAADPVEEVKVGFEILKSLKLRANGINFIACPSCSRQNFDVVGTMNVLEQRLEDVRTPMDVAVIGCIVNGPGEAREADVGLTGASPNNLIYVAGEPDHKVSNEEFVDHLEQVIRQRATDLEKDRAVQDEKLIVKSSA